MRTRHLPTLPPDLALVLGQVAHAVGDLWELRSRLSAAATDPSLDTAALTDAARAGAQILAPLCDRIPQIAAMLPAPADDAWDVEHGLRPLELTRASLECVLTDGLVPALRVLEDTADITLGSSVEAARSNLECVLADRIDPAIASLTAALDLPEEISVP